MERSPTRRRLLGAASAFAGGSALAAVANGAVPAASIGGAPAIDPILALIAECNRLDKIGGDFRNRADEGWFAVNKAKRRRYRGVDEADLPAPFGPLYAEAKRYEAAESELFDRIVETKPVTLAGAIAQLSLMVEAETDPLMIMALAGLRDIAAKGGAA
jgi:hypothetical protein